MSTGHSIHHVPARNKRIALYWLLLPMVLLIFVIVSFTVVRSIINAGVVSSTSATALSFIIGFLGLAAVILIPVGIIVAVFYRNKRELIPGADFDERSGKKGASVIPKEIEKWNWGAAGLTWIWGVYHGVWLSLLVFLPFLNIIMIIILGIKGNEWAWRAEHWKSPEAFLAFQNKWKVWGIIFLLINVVILPVLSIALPILTGLRNGGY